MAERKLSAVEHLIALAGTEKVSSYTRKDGTKVESYTRSPGDMSNVDLFKEYQSLTKSGAGGRDAQSSNRMQQLLTEIRQRQSSGEWGHQDAGASTRAAKRAEKKPLPGNKPEAKKKLSSRFVEVETDEKDEKTGEPKRVPVRDKEGAPIEHPEYQKRINFLTAFVESEANKEKYDTQRNNGVYDPNGEFVAYRPERAEMHKKIIRDILDTHSSVPKDKKALMSGGLGGAGKGTILGKPELTGYAEHDYLTIDPDQMKQELIKRGMAPQIASDVEGMDDLQPLETASFIHEESSDLANLLMSVALSEGMNVVLDTTMASDRSVDKKLSLFENNGYDVDAIFVDVPVDTSIDSAKGRHWRGASDFAEGKEGGEMGGRFVPFSYIESSRPDETSQFNSRNREVFERMIEANRFSNFQVWDNSDRRPDGEGGGPKLLKKSGAPSQPGSDTTAQARAKMRGKPPEKVALSAVERLRNLTSVR